MLSRSISLVCVATVSGFGCWGDGETSEASRLDVALTLPTADIGEIRSLGLFAVSAVEPEFDCSSYRSGERDPIAESPETLAAVQYIDIAQGEDSYPVSFRGVPVGRMSIIVEAYDAGGSRIFMGCEQGLIEAGRTTPLAMPMVEDPGER